MVHHFVQDFQRRGQLQITYILSKDMIVDGLIKPLLTRDFEVFIKQMGMLR